MNSSSNAARTAVFRDRVARARAEMERQGVDALLLSVGADLPYLIGYEAMPLPRLTMLVLHRERDATLVIPRLEAMRVEHDAELFVIRAWDEVENPIEIVDQLLGPARVAAMGDRTWARHLIDLHKRRPALDVRKASEVLSALRKRKDQAEIDALRAAAEAADRVAGQLHRGEIRLVGRTEADVSEEIGQRLVAEGHDKVNFAIVAAGENAASPHHHRSERVIRAGECVLFDFGGTMSGYCSDITRCVSIGEPSSEQREVYGVLFDAQAAAVQAARVGTPCEEVDAVARKIISDAGFGDYFIHRTGHGIGMDEHEDPYIVSGNGEPLAPGHAFSIEPGIYLPGRFGFRLEDIVVAADAGPDPLNRVDHHLITVEG